MTIVEFLNARLDEEEAKARAARGATWVASRRGGVVDLDDTEGYEIAGRDGGLAWPDADFMAHHDPARVLREIKAKRAIVAVHHPVKRRSTGSGGGTVEDCQMCDHFPAQYPCETIRAIASVYADHPDYQQEWTP